MMANVLKTLTTISEVVNTVNAVLPAAMAAYQSLYGIFKQAHPDATFEEFNAMLLLDASRVQDFSDAWLKQHGYVLVNGEWVKPDKPTITIGGRTGENPA